MDAASSRFQRALAKRLDEARAEARDAIVVRVGMSNDLADLKMQAGILVGLDRAAEIAGQIEAQLNAEVKG